MKIFSKCIYVSFLMILLSSCTKEEEPTIAPIRDRSEQFLQDIDSIDKYIDTHSMEVDSEFNVVFSEILAGSTVQSIRQQTLYPLQFKTVQDPVDDFMYKLYYINFREGVGRRPSEVDSIHVVYKGQNIFSKREEILPSTTPKTYRNFLDTNVFDSTTQPIWLSLDGVIPGWPEVFPLFKTGIYDTAEGPNPTSFSDFGAGIMFLPSGLGYFANAGPSGTIPVYAPLIFSFKLMELRYRDHDRDGILSKDEGNLLDPTVKLIDYDLDGDGFANYLDVDDDGDRKLTRLEINKNPDGTIIFEDCDGDGIPNYLDKDLCP